MAFFPSNRRNFIRLAAAAGVAAIAVDSFLVEPNHPRVVRREIGLRRWPAQLEGFTIALLSDLHYDRHFSAHPLKAAIGMVNDLRPDLIVLTGDFVTMPSFGGDDEVAAGNAEPCAELLRQMRATHGLWAVLGNHDCDTDANRVTNALLSQGIEVLGNRSVPIESKGARFWLSGLDDVISRTSNLNAALEDIPRDEATVLLVHEPDFADHVAKRPVDLQLSGHSHGGQVRVPLLPPLYLPHMGRKYPLGLYKIGPLTLYTNPGLGTIGLPIRLNCPPEITLLTVRRSVV